MAKALSANGRQTEEKQMSSRCADLELFMLIQFVTCNIRVTVQLFPATDQLSSRRCNSALRRINYPHKVQFSPTTAQLPSQRCNYSARRCNYPHKSVIRPQRLNSLPPRCNSRTRRRNPQIKHPSTTLHCIKQPSNPLQIA